MERDLLKELRNRHELCFDCKHLYNKFNKDGYSQMSCECNEDEELENKKEQIQIYKNRSRKVIECNLFEEGVHLYFLKD